MTAMTTFEPTPDVWRVASVHRHASDIEELAQTADKYGDSVTALFLLRAPREFLAHRMTRADWQRLLADISDGRKGMERGVDAMGRRKASETRPWRVTGGAVDVREGRDGNDGT